jgi:HD-GYP domain-containing protein (c-di-GMP phosphodiesterase class II)
MSDDVCAALAEICERWDGKGSPRGKAGEALLLPMRVMTIAHIAEIAHHRAGRASALEVVTKRAGGQLDPAIAKTFTREAHALFEAIEGESLWERFLDLEPEPHTTANPARVDDVALAFARVADLKSVWTLGHSTGVARLADAAANTLGCSDAEKKLLHRAALLHDIGRLSVPNRIHAMREPRAYRPPLDANQAVEALVAEVAAGRLDREAVTAVLDVAGAEGRPARAARPRGITDRELEVLRLLARGRSNKEIASALGISPRTAQHHVIHIYQKIERNSRAGAALFAVEHGLLDMT